MEAGVPETGPRGAGVMGRSFPRALWPRPEVLAHWTTAGATGLGTEFFRSVQVCVIDWESGQVEWPSGSSLLTST